MRPKRNLKLPIQNCRTDVFGGTQVYPQQLKEQIMLMDIAWIGSS